MRRSRFIVFITTSIRVVVLVLSFLWGGELICHAQINTDRMMNIGRNALAYDDYVLSISYFNLVINYKPHLYEPYFYRGVAKFYLDDYSGAALDCTQAIQRNPYFPNTYELRGLAYINMNRFPDAIRDYRTVTDMLPENRSLWHNLALCYIETDSLDQADSITDIIIRRWAKQADGYTLKAQVFLQKNDTAAAETYIDKAIEADKYNIGAHTAKANILMSHEQYNEAIQHFDESLRLNPKQANTLINRALCHYHLNHYRDAMADYDRALDLEPKNFIGHYNRGLLRANVGEDNLAIEDFNFILSIDPDDMMATFNRATLLENIGDYRGAIRDYTTVINEFPKFLYGYERRAAARRMIGDNAGANRDEEHVLKEQIAHRYGYSTPTSRQKNKTRKKSQINLDDYQKLVEEDTQEQEPQYESEYRGRVQNQEQEAKLMLPNENTIQLYKAAGRNDLLNTFQQAFQQAQAGNINEAIEGFTHVIQENDHFAEAYFNRGILHLLLDDTPHAIPDLSKAGELGIYQAYNIIKKNQNIKKDQSVKKK
ncbi:MAG: tetratricopeptide repeat protein [Bacteroidaceae bacterium]|nr:tetratricopeptide repeat protein [Bacteroidaceae bacterium]